MVCVAALSDAILLLWREMLMRDRPEVREVGRYDRTRDCGEGAVAGR